MSVKWGEQSTGTYSVDRHCLTNDSLLGEQSHSVLVNLKDGVSGNEYLSVYNGA